MNVFILCTGRCGSMSISRACSELSGYTSGHETKISSLGKERVNFPNNHIEADNRLAWFLGRLDEKYGDDAFYVHMTRDVHETANSYNRRWFHVGSIVRTFTEGILTKPFQTISSDERYAFSEDYCTTVNENIIHFLKDKNKKCVVRLEHLEADFIAFLDQLGYTENRQNALIALKQKHNLSRSSNSDFSYKVKLFILGIKNNLFKVNR